MGRFSALELFRSRNVKDCSTSPSCTRLRPIVMMWPRSSWRCRTTFSFFFFFKQLIELFCFDFFLEGRVLWFCLLLGKNGWTPWICSSASRMYGVPFVLSIFEVVFEGSRSFPQNPKDISAFQHFFLPSVVWTRLSLVVYPGEWTRLAWGVEFLQWVEKISSARSFLPSHIGSPGDGSCGGKSLWFLLGSKVTPCKTSCSGERLHMIQVDFFFHDQALEVGISFCKLQKHKLVFWWKKQPPKSFPSSF